jgi:hypothetical protein
VISIVSKLLSRLAGLIQARRSRRADEVIRSGLGRVD